MTNRNLWYLLLLCALFLASAVGVPTPALSQVMESSTYRIRADSVNFGGALSESSSYALEDTLGEIATGESESTTYKLKAGYQQMVVAAIAITSPSDVTMTSIENSGGTSNASVSWTVTTDNAAGYTLAVSASTDPALSSGSNSFADYTPLGADPDFSFSVAASAAEFGYSPEGDDIASRFQDNGSSCNAGLGDTADACWDGFSTANTTIASRTSDNHGSDGTATTVKLRAEIGSSASFSAGTYSATITATAVTR